MLETITTDTKQPATIKDIISGLEVKATPEEVDAVQVFAKRLIEDYGFPKSHIQTHPQFRVGKNPSDVNHTYPIDIAIFLSGHKIEENLFAIVECKRPEKKEGVKQLKIYMGLTSAQIGVWYNGNEHTYLWKIRTQNGGIDYREIPNIPFFGQRIEDIGKFYRKDLKKTQNLKAIFKDIRNHLAGQTTGITRDEALAQEIINILFCKIFDEINKGPNEIMDFRVGINEKPKDVKKRILDLFDIRVKAEYNDVFSENDTITLDSDSLMYVVGELQNYCITEADRDVIGDAFEVFIGPALRGNEGQFFTPRNVVKTVVEILDPNPEEFVIDPACGSGGFLIVALEYVWKKIEVQGKKKGMSQNWIKERQKAVATRYFRGIDKDSFLAKVTKAYMAIVGDGRGGVFCEDTIAPYTEWGNLSKNKIEFGQFDVLITNPPFGSKIPIKGEKRLQQFELGYKWKQKEKEWAKTDKLQLKQPPQILFIERCLQLLKEGGRMGIVLPDGVLGGEKMGYIASYIRKNTEILGIIDCPIETFSPSTTTKTHILFLKKKISEDKTKPVFMAVANHVGHDRKGRSIPKDDFPAITASYKLSIDGKLKEKNPLGYWVEKKWLEDNLIAKRYLPEYIDILKKIESSNFEKQKLTGICSSVRTGANVNAEHYSNNKGKPYIMVSTLTDEGLDLSQTKFVDDESYEKNKRSIVFEGDIITNRCGEIGVTAIVPPDFNGALACGFVFVLKIKKGYDPYYVSSFLNSEMGKKQLQRLAMGTTLSHITKTDLESISVLFPDSVKQKNISEIMKKAIVQRVASRKLLKENNDYLKTAF